MKLIVIFGEPATGKTTVAYELAKKVPTFRVLHNHKTLDIATSLYAFKSDACKTLTQCLRQTVFDHWLTHQHPDMIYTQVWMFDNPEQTLFFQNIFQNIQAKGGTYYLVSLTARKEVQMERCSAQDRLARKNVSAGEAQESILQWKGKHRFIPSAQDNLSDVFTIDTSDISPEEVAEKIIHHFSLEE